MQAMEYALRGLERRREVISNNVANSETPGFIASRVDFESQLRKALDRGDIGDPGSPASHHTSDAPGINGNNVLLETELTEMIRTNLLSDIMINTYNSKLEMLRQAIGAR
jgi:flagellar basal-body rod protein FlgB